MRTLYHYPLCPFSRKIRFILSEKKLDVLLKEEAFWKKNPDFIKLNPLGQVPILIDLQNQIICDSTVISEYLEEAYPERPLLGSTPTERAEIRRICAWFDGKFAQDVTKPLLNEKLFKRFSVQSKGPDSSVIRSVKNAAVDYLSYLGWLIERRPWIGGAFFSLADMTASSHISVIDYLGDVPWEKVPLAHEWFLRIKSRPSFRPFLKDRAAGLLPSKHYEDLDF